MAKSTKQLFNYAVESVDGNTFRCTTENEKEVIVKYTAYSGSINIDIDVFEKAIKNSNCYIYKPKIIRNDKPFAKWDQIIQEAIYAGAAICRDNRFC